MSTPPGPRLRDSAAVILVRGPGAALEAFWVRRSREVGFMPGFRAFVGGAVEPPDAALEIEGAAAGPERAILACAVRELFEETGVLLAAGAAAAPAARRRLLAGEASFADLAREHGWTFRAADLAFAGRWQTPPFAAVRFDTTFFLARLPAGQEPEVRAGELESGEWIRPAEALERWRRGEAVFAAPILHALRELSAGEEALAERLAAAPARAGQPVRRIEMSWGVVLHPMRTRPLPPATHTNAYLIGESEMLLLDPGSDEPAELEALFAAIDALAADGRRLALIGVTHHHRDHLAGVAAVRARHRVPVAAHPLAAAAAGADRVWEDGALVRLGGAERDWTLRVVHTPGHARDHVCLFHERTRSLWSGDHVIGAPGTVIVDPPDGDMSAYVASLERLLGLGVETLFPGHGAPQGAAERRLRWLIEHRRERARLVLEALGEAPRGLAELVERAYADTPRERWPYAERSLLAHLIQLEAEGRARRDGERWRLAAEPAARG